MGLKERPSRCLKNMAPILAIVCMCASLLVLPGPLLASSTADGQSNDQSASTGAKIQSTTANPTEKQSASTRTPVTSTAASIPSAIFLREYHTAPHPAEEPTRRAKITW
jgi:hypothetical protein